MKSIQNHLLLPSYLFLFVSILLLFIVGCSKSVDSVETNHQKQSYRVLGVGMDTSTSQSVIARTEATVLYTAQDSRLKAELIGFQNINGIAHYTVRMTNPQTCQMILRWNWEDLGITDIHPDDSTQNTPASDVLRAGEVKIYILTGKPKVGKITVKAEKSNSTCPNSSTLVIPITLNVLPVKFLKFVGIYNNDLSTSLMWTIDDPSIIDYFIIQKLINGTWTNIQTIPCDKNRKSWELLVWDDPR